MIITYFRKAGTVTITDKEGSHLGKKGDDKMLCPDDIIIQYIIDTVEYLTGKRFFFVKETDDITKWETLE